MSQQIGYRNKPLPMRVKQGATITIRMFFKNTITGESIDVSSETFTGQVRKLPSSATVSASFSFDLSQASSGIVFATLAGSSTASLPAGDVLGSKDGQYFYDIRRTKDGVDKYPIPLSPLTLEPRVTRSA
jgi:hypothetical protein